jgi:TolB protein
LLSLPLFVPLKNIDLEIDSLGGINMQLFYTVRTGDTLYQIANRWEVPVNSLVAANNLTPPYTIYIGQQLSIPPGVNVVRVKQGDTVFRLSQYFGVPQSVIVEANRLQPPYVIQVGQLLNIPSGVPFYIVQRGDTLFQIARRFNVITGGQINHELIRVVNQLQSNVIFPGMRLHIPYAPPGDSGLIAYTSNRGGTYDIWLYNPSNGTNVKVTNGLAENFSVPVWSGDSRKIAFVGKDAILYVAYLDNEMIASIDQFDEGLGVHLDWSPDSYTLAYTKESDIILYDVTSHEVQRINQSGATDVEWFPSGEELLFQAPDSAGFSQLYRIQTNGTGKEQVTQNTEGRHNNVRLSPDGTFALYTTPGASISIIHTVDISTGNIVEIKGGPLAKNYFPEWSPNSRNIAYSSTAFEDRGYFSMIRSTGRRGENDRTLAISDCFATPVTWSSDGGKFAYLSGCNDQGAASEMWVVNVNHPAPIRLIEGVQITALQWSPTPIKYLTKTFTSNIYKVQLQYPAHWKKVNDERYEGPDGFFQISAISSDSTIDEVCHSEAFHQLMPYGSKPRINKRQIQNQEACLIFPSQDQPAEMGGQAALIVRYPQPIQIEGTTYNFFILWADQVHINNLSSSLTFL